MVGVRTLAVVTVLGFPVSASAADLPARTAAWMTSLGIPTPTPRIVVIGDGWGVQAVAVHPATIGVTRGNLRPFLSGGAGEMILHELIHLSGTNDEGVTQAVALDLLPAWERRFPFRGQVIVVFGGVYTDEVQNIRQKSARACGCPWTSREARLWRRGRLTGY